MSQIESPVIVIGMHRSGTSLVTRLLDKMGLFVGRKKDRNHEPWFFMRLNEWLLRQCGGAWDQPAPIRHLLDNQTGRSAVVRYLERMMRSPQALSYLGAKRYMRYRGIGPGLAEPWGWKDPRNTFTLPIWLDLFPDARVVHVYRHGVDVAASLHERQQRSQQESGRRAKQGPLGHLVMPRAGGFVDSWRCADLDQAMALWSEYIQQASSHVAALGEQAMEIRYEDLLEHPEPILRALSRFCELPGAAVSQLAEGIRPARALAYKQESALRDVASRWQEQLKSFGY